MQEARAKLDALCHPDGPQLLRRIPPCTTAFGGIGRRVRTPRVTHLTHVVWFELSVFGVRCGIHWSLMQERGNWRRKWTWHGPDWKPPWAPKVAWKPEDWAWP